MIQVQLWGNGTTWVVTYDTVPDWMKDRFEEKEGQNEVLDEKLEHDLRMHPDQGGV